VSEWGGGTYLARTERAPLFPSPPIRTPSPAGIASAHFVHVMQEWAYRHAASRGNVLHSVRRNVHICTNPQHRVKPLGGHGRQPPLPSTSSDAGRWFPRDVHCRRASRWLRPASRARRTPRHTMTMNFMVSASRCWPTGRWASPCRRAAWGRSARWRYDQLSHRSLGDDWRKTWGLFGGTGFFLTGVAYTAPVSRTSCSRWCSWTRAATIPHRSAGRAVEFAAFAVFSVFVGAIIYPIYANWTWGGGWLSALGKKNLGLGHGHVASAGFVRVHMTGGVNGVRSPRCCWGPRAGEDNADGTVKCHFPATTPDGAGRPRSSSPSGVRVQRRIERWRALTCRNRGHRDEPRCWLGRLEESPHAVRLWRRLRQARTPRCSANGTLAGPSPIHRRRAPS